MAALTPIYIMRRGGDYGERYIVFIVEDASSADTVTVSTLSKISDTVALEMESGAEVACSEATNVVTIGGAITSLDCIIMVSGN